VFHAVLGVLLALVPAEAARSGASLQGCVCHLGIEGRLAGQYLAGGLADVGAVEVEPYAAGQRLHVLLAEAGVGARGAGLGAVEAGLEIVVVVSRCEYIVCSIS
jgi:hypothetical protein